VLFFTACVIILQGILPAVRAAFRDALSGDTVSATLIIHRLISYDEPRVRCVSNQGKVPLFPAMIYCQYLVLSKDFFLYTSRTRSRGMKDYGFRYDLFAKRFTSLQCIGFSSFEPGHITKMLKLVLLVKACMISC
jgi:hypothetical protein